MPAPSTTTTARTTTKRATPARAAHTPQLPFQKTPPEDARRSAADAEHVGEHVCEQVLAEMKAVGSATSRNGGLQRTERATTARRPAWRTLLCGGTPREVLARIVDGDPLDLRPRAAVALRRGAWLMDADRVHLRALALCARRGVTYRGRPCIDEWLQARVEEAISDLLEEDAEAQALKMGGAFSVLAAPLSLSPKALRAACARFHARPREEREAYVRLVLDRQPLKESGANPLEVARCARRAVLALMGPAVTAPVTAPVTAAVTATATATATATETSESENDTPGTTEPVKRGNES